MPAVLVGDAKARVPNGYGGMGDLTWQAPYRGALPPLYCTLHASIAGPALAEDHSVLQERMRPLYAKRVRRAS